MGIGLVTVGSRRAAFLDRDGVLNRAIVKNGKPYPPATTQELEVPADVPGALVALKAAGLLLIGVTNQPDVARGALRREEVDSINRALRAALPLDDLLVCYHDDPDACECRKPKAGLLIQAAAKHDINLRSSFMIGDRWRDVAAGRSAGCTTILIDYGYAESGPGNCSPDGIVGSIAEAAAWILARTRLRRGTS